MITPAGRECRYYYADYYRGRERQECRLIAQNKRSAPWKPELCRSCPAPGILRANACPNLVLYGSAEKNLLGLIKRMKVSAICKLSNEVVKEPHIGCGKCHPLPDVFKDL